ncbi:MAG TPA: 2Fe-2S iron-sulfur cluster-binding protein [Ilumatobacter sp.]|nr:2Fe-2S iron-sulfur cluster-binding protein [Ilumatobacter sp.]
MPKIRFVRADGSVTVVDADVGQSIMQVAVGNGIDGIVGECGGSRMCATCHVHVDLSGVGGVPVVSEDEDELLDFAASPRSELSRLSCQLPVSEEMDGITVALPERQT